MATIERHILLKYPEWHKRNITIRFVKAVECGTVLLLLFLMLLLTMLQFGVDEFRAFDSANFTLLGTLYPPVEMIRLGNLQIPSNYHGEEQNKEDQQHPSSFFVLIGNYRVSQLEIKAVESTFFMGLVYLILKDTFFKVI